MTISKDVAMKLWKDVFGDVKWAVDCYGTWIYRDDYGECESTRKRPNGDGNYYHYGWTLDHIKPKTSFKPEIDPDFYNNLEPVQCLNNNHKSNKYPDFEIKGVKYQVVNCDICAAHGLEGYGIKNIKTGKRVDWKAMKNSYYG